MAQHATVNITPEPRRYLCLTCAGLLVSATSALQHIADTHVVVSGDGIRQDMSEHARQAFLVQRGDRRRA